MSDETTNERLTRFGFKTDNAAYGQKHLYDADGRHLFTGSVFDVRSWLDGFEAGLQRAVVFADRCVKTAEDCGADLVAKFIRNLAEDLKP